MYAYINLCPMQSFLQAHVTSRVHGRAKQKPGRLKIINHMIKYLIKLALSKLSKILIFNVFGTKGFGTQGFTY